MALYFKCSRCKCPRPVVNGFCGIRQYTYVLQDMFVMHRSIIKIIFGCAEAPLGSDVGFASLESGLSNTLNMSL